MGKIADWLHHLYAVIALVTMALGFFVFLLFAFGLLVGGSLGETVAIWAGEAMKWGIRLAAIAVLAGLIYLYIKNKHSLTIDSEKGHSVAEVEKGI